MDRYVYAINDEHGEVCYIGMGKGRRMYDHFHDGRRSVKRALHEYIDDCRSRGIALEPYQVADQLSLDNALAYERTLIAWYGRRDLGRGNLFNVTDGGRGVKQPSPASRTKMSEMMKKNEKVLATLRRVQKVAVEAARRVNIGKSPTPETRAKISAAHIGKVGHKQSPESIAKTAAKNRGQKRSDETRANISKGLTGIKRSV